MKIIRELSLVLLLMSAAPATAQQNSDALKASLLATDAAFFDLFFNRCDPPVLAAMVTPKMEFYHDREGFIFGSRKALVTDYQKNCTARQKPDAWRSRRALVPESFHVESIKGYGALTRGEHLFYERKGDGPEKLVGRALFLILWKQDKDKWLLDRAISHDHSAISAPVPPASK